MEIPSAVSKRLAVLMLDPLSIQNPNFTADDLDYHEPPSIGLVGGATRGSWSHDGIIFEFRLIGQVSSNQTFPGDYGDMFHMKERSRQFISPDFTVGDVTKAKRKVSVAIPHVNSEDEPHQILRRQFEHLQQIEDEDFRAYRKEMNKKSSFVFKNDTHWRASAWSDNIFNIFDSIQSDLPAVDDYDPNGIVAKFPKDVRKKMQVMPFEFVGSNGQEISRARVADVFRPGTWVELSCSIRVWTRSAADRGGPGRPTRSYQIRVDGMQRICAGRIKEGPIRFEPAPRAAKRKLLCSISVLHPKPA